MQNGWDAGLISDEYLIPEFFTKEQTQIENLEISQSEKETNLEEAIEEAINLLEYEAEEDEKVTNSKVKEQLKKNIDYLVKEKKKLDEAKPFQAIEKTIKTLEAEIKEIKANLKVKQAELELKLILKRYGSEEEKEESIKLLKIVNSELDKLNIATAELIIDFKANLKNSSDFENIKKSITALEKELKANKTNEAETLLKLSKVIEAKKQIAEIAKQVTSLAKDKGIINNKLNKLDNLLIEIGGMITTDEAQKLILKKHFDIINNQLQRYLNAEKRALIGAYENLFDKYFVSADSIEKDRNNTMKELNDFLTDLKYLN
jgi:type I restriction enzyme M protein